MSQVEKTGVQEPGPEIAEDAQRLLDEVDAEIGPEVSETEPETGAEVVAPYDERAAESEADIVTDIIADMVEGLHPALSYDTAVRAQVSHALVPVIQKYGGVWPAWLEPYKEEVGFAIVLGGVAYGSVTAVRNYQPEPAEGAGRGEEA